MKEEIIKRVMWIMGWDEIKALAWYNAPNPNFGCASPNELVQGRRGHKVLNFFDVTEDKKRSRKKIESLRD